MDSCDSKVCTISADFDRRHEVIVEEDENAEGAVRVSDGQIAATAGSISVGDAHGEQGLQSDKTDCGGDKSRLGDKTKTYDNVVLIKGGKRTWSKMCEYLDAYEAREGPSTNSGGKVMCCRMGASEDSALSSSCKASTSHMVNHIQTAHTGMMNASEGSDANKSKERSSQAEVARADCSPCHCNRDSIAYPATTEQRWHDVDERFCGQSSELQLSPASALDKLTKQTCPCCLRKRMFFCYDCRLYMCGIEKLAPVLKLPVNVDIIKHPREKNGKSTALHCLLIAPTSTRLFDAPNVCDYRDAEDRQNTVLVYPSKDAISIEEFIRRNGPIQRFVFLDATWFQVGGLRMLPQIEKLQAVVLKSYKTQYWRPQKGYSDQHLATIEAIYYAIREAFEASTSQPYEGQFDNLLFWFFYFRSKVPQNVFQKNMSGRDRIHF